MPADGVADRLAQLTLFADLRWPEIEGLSSVLESMTMTDVNP